MDPIKIGVWSRTVEGRKDFMDALVNFVKELPLRVIEVDYNVTADTADATTPIDMDENDVLICGYGDALITTKLGEG